ncbi:MAG: hypothetical protein AB1428_14595 [Bacteroidota bacterium]
MSVRTRNVLSFLIIVAAAGWITAGCYKEPVNQWPPDRLTVRQHTGNTYEITPIWRDTVTGAASMWATQDTIPFPPRGFMLSLVRQDTIPKVQAVGAMTQDTIPKHQDTIP